MALRDFLLLVLVCAFWASNNIVSKYVVATLQVSPMVYACARFALVAAVVSPWLLPMPRPHWRLVAVALLMGALNFTLVFMAFRSAAPSAVAVVSQVGMPMTVVLSVVMLRERIGPRRALGMALTLAGVLAVMWDPHGFRLAPGLLWVVASSFCGSLGVVMMKQMPGVKPLQFQAWVGFCAAWPLAALVAVFEPAEAPRALAAGWPFAVCVLFSALVVSVLAHTLYYHMVQRYDANLISSLTLMTPLFTIALGVMITHDPFGLRLALGAAVALAGVLVIALRPNRALSMLAALRNR
jgi:drug/metabolite transporter (DMT)-like permease